jgi:hypothetical protein
VRSCTASAGIVASGVAASFLLVDPLADIIIVDRAVGCLKYNVTGNLFTSSGRSLGLYIVGFYI